MRRDAADAYAACFEARDAQDRLMSNPAMDDRWAQGAARFRRDPHRELESELAAVAAYLRPEDVVVDVGGGAGRFGLPLALRCRELINVEPSPAMAAEFEAARTEAGITNARLIPADWLAAAGVGGDVTFVAHVTYFVRDILPFVEKLAAAARRRVMIVVDAVPPPDRGAEIFPLLFGAERRRVPGYRELLPVLWEMGLLPEARLIPGQRNVLRTQEDAERAAMRMAGPQPEHQQRAAALVREHFDDLFVRLPDGFTWRAAERAEGLLITWETGREPA